MKLKFMCSSISGEYVYLNAPVRTILKNFAEAEILPGQELVICINSVQAKDGTTQELIEKLPLPSEHGGTNFDHVLRAVSFLLKREAGRETE